MSADWSTFLFCFFLAFAVSTGPSCATKAAETAIAEEKSRRNLAKKDKKRKRDDDEGGDLALAKVQLLPPRQAQSICLPLRQKLIASFLAEWASEVPLWKQAARSEPTWA
jgi:hypothetical protein